MPIDILVNSAAIGGVNTRSRISGREWRAVIDVNLTGTFLTCRAVVPGMQRRGYGRIVNISVDRRQGGQSERLRLFGLQGRRIALTKSLGKELPRPRAFA